MTKSIARILLLMGIIFFIPSVHAMPIEFRLDTPLEYIDDGQPFLGTDATFSLTFTLDSTAIPDEERIDQGGLGDYFISIYNDVPGQLSASGSESSISITTLKWVSLVNFPSDPDIESTLVDTENLERIGLSVYLPGDFWTGSEFPRPQPFSSTSWTLSIFDRAGYFSYYSAGHTTSIAATATSAAPIPEPSTLLLFGTGLIGLLLGWGRKMFKRN